MSRKKYIETQWVVESEGKMTKYGGGKKEE
jgi:hypothetical protein